MLKWLIASAFGSIVFFKFAILPGVVIDWHAVVSLIHPKVMKERVGECTVLIDRDTGLTLNKECPPEKSVTVSRQPQVYAPSPEEPPSVAHVPRRNIATKAHQITPPKVANSTRMTRQDMADLERLLSEKQREESRQMGQTPQAPEGVGSGDVYTFDLESWNRP